MEIRALLLDLGGVVIDIDFQRIFAKWSSYCGLPADTIARAFSVDAAYEQHERGELSGQDYHLYLQRNIGMELSYNQFCEGWNDIMIAPFELTISALEQVKSRLPVYALSNSNHLHKGHWESSFPDQMSHFDRVFVSSDLGLRKPDPAIYTRVLEELDIHPMNVLFFDDLEANIEAARALGLQTVLVKSPQDIVIALQERSLLR